MRDGWSVNLVWTIIMLVVCDITFTAFAIVAIDHGLTIFTEHGAHLAAGIIAGIYQGRHR